MITNREKTVKGTKQAIKAERNRTYKLDEVIGEIDLATLRRQNGEVIGKSYHGYGDILKELTANAADTVISLFGFVRGGKVTITIDRKSRTITVSDNGAGIKLDDLWSSMTVVGFSTKDGVKGIGIKGVALKFLLSCSDFIEITTNTGNEAYTAIVSNYGRFVNDGMIPSINVTSASTKTTPKGTTIRINNVNRDMDFFAMVVNEYKTFVLAECPIGHINNGLIDITLTVDGDTTNFTNTLLTPEIACNGIYDVVDWATIKGLPKLARKIKCQDKIIYEKKVREVIIGGIPRSVTFLTYTMTEKMAINIGLQKCFGSCFQVKNGFLTGAKVIVNSDKVRGVAYAIDDLGEFDTGRKTVVGWKEYLGENQTQPNLSSKTLQSYITESTNNFDRDSIVEILKQQSPVYVYDKKNHNILCQIASNRNGQSMEQVVMKLVDMGMLKGIKKLDAISSIKKLSRYDFAHIVKDELIDVLECSSTLMAFLEDVVKNTKMLDEVDIVFVWNTDNVFGKIGKMGFELVQATNPKYPWLHYELKPTVGSRKHTVMICCLENIVDVKEA